MTYSLKKKKKSLARFEEGDYEEIQVLTEENYIPIIYHNTN